MGEYPMRKKKARPHFLRLISAYEQVRMGFRGFETAVQQPLATNLPGPRTPSGKGQKKITKIKGYNTDDKELQ